MKKNVLGCMILLLFCRITAVIGQDTAKVYTSGFWEYTANDKGWTITDYKGNQSDIIIPPEFDGKPVTQLAEELFMNTLQLESIEIPDTVTLIGAKAFQGCSNLKSVSLSESIKRIYDQTFQYCTSLESISIPASVTNIALESFSNCVKLKEIIIPAKVTTIGSRAFDNCQSLSSVKIEGTKLSRVLRDPFRDTPWLKAQTDEFVTLPGGVLLKYNGNAPEVRIPEGTTSISNAFEGNTSIESVTMPDSVKLISYYAFYDAVNLQNVQISNSVTRIETYAFANCRSMKSIELPESITQIDSSAFRNCERLESLTIPSQVTTIPTRMAAGCPALRDVRIPEVVTKIAKNAFDGSPNVNIQVVPGSPAEDILKEYGIAYTYQTSESNGFVYRASTDGLEIVRYTGDLYHVEIPAAINGQPVTSIGTGAFQNTPNIRSIRVPLAVKTVGDWAFSYMDDLETVYLPAGLNFLGSSAFVGSPKLSEVSLPRSLTLIGAMPFDESTTAAICTAEGSPAEAQLLGMGYTVSIRSGCSADPQTNALWKAYFGPTSCDCDPEIWLQGRIDTENAEIVGIPDGLETLSADLVSSITGNIILAVPDSVKSIDPAILNGRTVTIYASPGSFAETFARENGVKFVVKIAL